MNELIDIEKFINENIENNFTDIICKLFSQRSNISVKDDVSKRHITFINLDGYKKFVKEEKKDSLKDEIEKTFITSDDEFAFSNMYGKVSILLLLGTMLITLGVVLTILMFS